MRCHEILYLYIRKLKIRRCAQSSLRAFVRSQNFFLQSASIQDIFFLWNMSTYHQNPTISATTCTYIHLFRDPTMKLHSILMLTILCFAAMPWSASGFQSVQRITSTGVNNAITRQGFVVLHASQPDSGETPITWKKVKEINDKFWDFTVNFFYVIMTLGIVLNLSGFAYKVSPDEGLKINTIAERRQELQWNQELQKYENEASMNQKSMLEKSEM
jgi:hypothetical protein